MKYVAVKINSSRNKKVTSKYLGGSHNWKPGAQMMLASRFLFVFFWHVNLLNDASVVLVGWISPGSEFISLTF